MGKARFYRFAFKASFFTVVALAFAVGMPAHKAYAGVNRAPKNQVETDRSGLCPGAYTIYGAVWINDVDPADGTDARWSDTVTVASGATTVDVTMWTTAYNCPTGYAITGSEIYDLAPAPGGVIPISFPNGNNIYRGDSNPGEFTDPPGSLRVTIDITGQPSGCYDKSIAYSGTYRDSLTPVGASNTYFTSVCITREPPPNEPPKFAVDLVDCDIARGWAFDPDTPNVSIPVHMYVDGPAGDPAATGYPHMADQPRPDVNAAYPATGNTPHGFIIDLKPFKDAYPSRTFYFYAIGDAGNTFMGSWTVGPCATVTCSITAPLAAVNEPFNISLGYSYVGAGTQGRPLAPEGKVSFKGGPYSAPYAYPTGTFTHAFGPYNQNAPGTFTADGIVSQAGVFSASCHKGDVNVAAKPYVKIFGNDAAAGGKFADATVNSCTAGANKADPAYDASLWAFTKKVTNGANNYYGGASSQFAAFALGQNEEFFSAGARNGVAAPNPAVGLSFGNMIASGKVTDYGGKGGLYRCIPDYFSAKPAANQPGVTILPGGSTIAGLNVADNTRPVYFVNGNVTISNDIKFANTTWASTASIPAFYLIVKGDIYIDRNVKNLDGIYVAQPNSATGGHIYTCTNGGSLYDPNDLYNNCQNKLTITGSFIADQVRYQRTRGTVGNSIADAPPQPSQLNLQWSSSGPIAGKVCTQIYEGAEPPQYTWTDNYLCANSDIGLRWSQSGPIGGMTCIPVNPPSEPAIYSWADNRLCWPAGTNPGLTWSDNGPVAGKYCFTNWTEIADPNWDNAKSYLCEPTVPTPAYTPTNEDANSGNIAEVFNFSQEMYLAKQPDILAPIIGGTVGPTKYNAITSLPPIL